MAWSGIYLIMMLVSDKYWEHRSRPDSMPLHKPNIRTVIAFVHDLAAAVVAWWLAYSFRFNFEIPPLYLASLQEILPWVILIHAAAFLWFGLYRGLWHYASLPDLRRILLAVLTSAAAVPLALFMLQILAGIPRTVLLLAPILLLFIMGGSRLAYRLWKEHRLYGQKKSEGNLVLVLGAGDAAVGLVKELARSVQWRVVGLLDDDPAKLGMMLHGFKVLGRINELPAIAEKLGVAHAIIAMTPTAPDRRKTPRSQLDRRHPDRLHRDRRRALEMCSAAGVKALIVPSYDDLISGKITVSQIRTVELEDLLGRDPVVLDNDGLHGLLAGKTVLVTGAGGSIGSELCRQIAKFQTGPPGAVRVERIRALQRRAGTQSQFPGNADGIHDRRYQRSGPAGSGVLAISADRCIPCRGLQACSADGAGKCLASRIEQCIGNLRPGADCDPASEWKNSY